MSLKKFFHKEFNFSTTQMIAGGFLIAIFVGAFLLTLPISSANGDFTPFIDALFTSTTSICVTGLTTVTTLTHWSLFGKLVILALIQFGGLGVITFTTTILLILGRRITLKDRLLIQDAYNLNTLRGLVKLTIKIIKGTLIIEGMGAIFFSFTFIPEFGLIRGIWKSIFHSVSAFCNAGIDLIGDYSFAPYQNNVIINFTTMALIIVGGIGFPVWWDVLKVIKNTIKNKCSVKCFFTKLELHTKLALSMTAILIFGGAILILLFEYRNSNTIANLSFGQKVMSSIFQSVTTRTAGFFTIPQADFTNASSFLSIILMFIGGSPSGTAGGVKTVTVATLFIATISIIKGRADVEIFGRKIEDTIVKKGMAIFMISFFVLLVSTALLSLVEHKDFFDIIFETTSALATVGLTRGITPSLSGIGKLIIICTMYLGRIGPITMALAFNTKKEKSKSRALPAKDIMVG